MKLLLVPAVALAVSMVLSGCSDDGDPRVQAAPVGRADVAEVVDAPGTVTARATAAVTAPADATVAAVLVEDGAQVARGAELARLSSPQAQERLQSALDARASAASGVVARRDGDLAPAQDALDAAAASSFSAGRSAAHQITDPALRAAAERQVVLAEQQYALAATAARTALAQLDAGADSLQNALAAVSASQRAQAQLAVDAARATVEALVVRAPIAGVVTLGAAGAAPAAPGADLGALVEGLPPGVQEQASAALGGSGGGSAAATVTEGLVAGTQVTTGSPLLTVTDVSGLTVTAEVDETDVLLVSQGTTAVVEVDAVPGAQYPATVQAVDVSPTSSAGGGVTYRVRLALGAGTLDDGKAPAPRPGMSAVVDLQVRSAEDAVAVPTAAVVRDDGDAVFVVSAGRAVRREVRLGAQGEDLVEVLSGVAPGDLVVVRDADRLRDGQAVTS